MGYPEFLNVRPYMSQSSGEPVLYGLYAVLVHSGYSCHAGHYYCYVKVSAAPRGGGQALPSSAAALGPGVTFVRRAQAPATSRGGRALMGDALSTRAAEIPYGRESSVPGTRLKGAPSPPWVPFQLDEQLDVLGQNHC